jgi:hypothetical protein
MNANILFCSKLSKTNGVADGLGANRNWFAGVLSETKHIENRVNCSAESSTLLVDGVPPPSAR